MASDRCLPYFMLLILISGFTFVPTPVASSSSIGINYGQIANNLPSPDDVIPLVKSVGATRLKLYDADPRVLRAFAGTGVEFTIGLGNDYLTRIRDPNQALTWLKSNVQAYLPSTKITCITVGNEVLTFNDTSLTANLLPAMQSLQGALAKLGLDDQVTVTTPHSLAVLETSYPPSSGAFRRDLAAPLTEILKFQARAGSPFLINAYPFFAYKANPRQVPLNFVLFESNPGVVDPSTGLHYDNMLFAQIDAVHSALASLGFRNLTLHISETGWPSKGDANEVGATPENARKYNGNLMKIMAQKNGTPLRPSGDLNVYVFALFNENLKPGPASERNYGLFKPDGTPAYALAPNGSDAGGNGRPASKSGSPPPETATPTPASTSTSSSTGYLAISSGVERCHHNGRTLLVLCLAAIKLLF
ncbi:glucan endo-1,3-beta-glucosidase 11-like [Rhodamnia argentea]|uniref:glucan endo-1,3-beta-D-glucosidase n=1 Tax=Rhodamnia argentea TaxID=178133 RepID=A0ABM3H6H4_9MYRT|nr:glucan endo-1,3-beta-glucosidase 11-like [Rhodamnia argentea]XP_048132183.1 glucan endo-1,3-beta-glucosidase 11-like [Rhodamnia argentea]